MPTADFTPGTASEADLARTRASFTDPQEFWSSPLYRRLSAVVASDAYLLSIAAQARAGQGPTFLFFAAVQLALFRGEANGHVLGRYFASIDAERARPPDDEAGPALSSFVHEHEAEVVATLRTRFVQTNHVQRAFALRLGLASVAADLDVTTTPLTHDGVHLLEIGSSAGLLLRHDLYRYELGGRVAGSRDSPVRLTCDWRGADPPPDLDRLPTMASVTGIDLHPLDPRNPADRQWLQALVWPEDRAKADVLTAALDVAAHNPARVMAGDAIDVCQQWSAEHDDRRPRVVFHCATRMHVPRPRLAAFDAAIDAVGQYGPLYVISVEGDGLKVRGPRSPIAHYDVEGHLAWIAPHAARS